MGPNGEHTILVWDEAGKVSDAVRRAAIGAPVWRVSERPKSSDLEQVDLAIVALYGPSDWSKISPPILRTRTVIVSTTSDRRDASRPFSSGAFGYLAPGPFPPGRRRA